MNVVVTGATGLIGSKLVLKLMDFPDVNVIAVSRSEYKLKRLFDKYSNQSRFHYFAQDLSVPFDFDEITEKKFAGNIDFIYHAASPISAETIRKFPSDVIKSNLFSTINFLEYSLSQKTKYNKKCKIILFSSVTAYGNNYVSDCSLAEDCTDITETLDCANAPYSESKRMLEVLAKSYVRQYDIDAIIVRPAFVYGDTFFPPQTALYSFIDAVCHNKDIQLNKSGLSRRDNIHVDDVVSALLLLAQKGISGESYNVSSNGDLGNYAAIDEIAEMIAKINNEKYSSNTKVIYSEDKTSSRKPGIMLNSDKLKGLGWKLTKSLEEGIVEMLEMQYKRNNTK